jgi:pimeloyl-ACP methyl ester carboxylesterase
MTMVFARLATLIVLAFSCADCSPVAARPPAQRAAPTSVSPATDPRFDAELSAYPYPFDVRFLELRTQYQTVRMAYMDVLPVRPNGHTVVLLHGKNFTASYWERTIRPLAASGYRVIAPDQIGFGKSSKPIRYQYSFHQLAQNTVALLDAAGVKRVSVVGHSMVNPIGLEDWKAVVPYRSIDQWYEQELKATGDSVREYQRTNYYDGKWTPEYEQMIEIAKGVTRHRDYPTIAWASALTYDMIFTQPVVYELPLIRVPTLLVIGQRDRTALGRAWVPKEVAATLGDYPALGRRAAQAIPGSRLVEIQGVGHLPQVEAYDVYAKALTEFLP